MPKYAYIAIDARGSRISGEIDAGDPDSAVSRLTGLGMRIESLVLAPPDMPVPHEKSPAPKLSAGDAREISGHIAEVVSGGLPLEEGLAAIAEEYSYSRMSRTLRRIVSELER